MKITTAKEFMQVIAKHYEKCRAVYWDVMHGIILIGKRFVKLEGLPEDPEERQGVAIMHAIFAALTFESVEQEHTVATDILPEVYEKFGLMMAIEKFVSRGYMEWDKEKKDEDGFPAIKIIVPPNEWDMSEEA